MAKIFTLLLFATLFIYTAKGFISLEKELPSLTREKRLSDILDEPVENDASEAKVKEGNNRLGHTDDRSMNSGSHPYHHHEVHITRQGARHNSGRVHYENRAQESKSVPWPSSKTNEEAIALDSQLDKGQHHKIILPKVEFVWFRHELARAPPPSDEIRHQIRRRMKQKKRRRLRELKRISESEAGKQQTHKREKTSGQLQRASVEQRLKSVQEEMKSQGNSDSSSSKSTEKNKLNFSVPSKQLDSSRKREALSNNYSPSSLKRPKRIPFNGDNAETNRFSSLEITLRSKMLSLNPESSSTSRDAPESSLSSKLSSTGLSSSSVDKMQAEDILRSFFQNGSAGSAEKGENRDPRKSDIQDKSIKEPRGPGEKYGKKVRQQKRDQGYDDYELKLLEFQKKAIEEEEKRLKEQFGPEIQDIQVNKGSTIEQLDQENDAKEREIHLLFEKLTKTNKQTRDDHQEQNALDQNGAKRSFGVNANLNKYKNNDLDDGNDGAGGLQTKLFQSRKRMKIPKSNDKEMIEKERIINAGRDSGNDDEITEVAFYEKNDDITNENQNQNEKSTDGQEWDPTGVRQLDGMKDKTSLPAKSDNGETTMQSSAIKKPKDIQNNIELDEPVNLSSRIEDTKLENNNEQEVTERPEDEMDRDDVMKSQGYEGKNKRKADTDILKQQPSKLQNVKSEGNFTGNKGSDKAGVEIEVVSDKPNPPIFTEITDSGQEGNDKMIANEKEREMFDKEAKKEIATSDVSESKTTEYNNNNNNNVKNNTSTSGDSINGDDNSNSSKQIIINEDNDNDVMLHDNRLMYILTGEGAKPSKKGAEFSDNVKEMARVKVSNTIHRETEKTEIESMNKDKPLVQNHIVINKGLKSKIKEMHDRILNAHNRVSQELEQMEQELSTRFNTLQESMSMAKKLTANMDSKINNSVLSVMKLATSSAEQAKTKLTLVQKAAAALKNIEEKIGANETRNFAKTMRHKLPDFSVQKNKTYQKILAINNVITKMDGARLIALDKANQSYIVKARIEDSMSKVAGNVLDELKSTERELNDDTEMEIEDEIEADRKIRDAKSRNYRAAVRTAQALQDIEGYLKQLENDESRLRTLEN